MGEYEDYEVVEWFVCEVYVWVEEVVWVVVDSVFLNGWVMLGSGVFGDLFFDFGVLLWLVDVVWGVILFEFVC